MRYMSRGQDCEGGMTSAEYNQAHPLWVTDARFECPFCRMGAVSWDDPEMACSNCEQAWKTLTNWTEWIWRYVGNIPQGE
jgi:hypothetical protein